MPIEELIKIYVEAGGTLEKIKKLTRSECIKLMKENESTKFEDWPEEVQEVAREIGDKDNFEFLLEGTSEWPTVKLHFTDCEVFRLKSDWQDEDEKFKGFDGIEFKEVYDSSDGMGLLFDDLCDEPQRLSDAPSHYYFAGYGYEIYGKICLNNEAVRYIDGDHVFPVFVEGCKIIRPKWVVFKKEN